MMNPIEAFGKTGATGIILGIWAAAIICIIGAVSQAQRTSDMASQAQALQSLIPATINIREESLAKEDYDVIASSLSARYTSVKIASGRKALEIQSNSVDAYSAWLAAMFDVMASRPDVRWKVVTLCAGESCSGPSFRVELEGIRRIANSGG